MHGQILLGAILVLLTKGVNSECDTAALKQCTTDLEASGLLLTDPCGYIEKLADCLYSHHAECIGTSEYLREVENMNTLKSIFCPVNSGCDLGEVDKCLQTLDFSALVISDPSTYPTFCGPNSTTYKSFEACYNKAGPPCFDDPNFLRSDIQNIVSSVSLICLTTTECDYLGMMACSSLIQEVTTESSIIPNTNTYTKICPSFLEFENCFSPLTTSCRKIPGAKHQIMDQMQQLYDYLKFNCFHDRTNIEPYAVKCYDKSSVSAVLNICNENFINSQQASPNLICKNYEDFVECIYQSILKECNLGAAQTAGRYAENLILLSPNGENVSCEHIRKHSTSIQTTISEATTVWISPVSTTKPTVTQLPPTTTRRFLSTTRASLSTTRVPPTTTRVPPTTTRVPPTTIKSPQTTRAQTTVTLSTPKAPTSTFKPSTTISNLALTSNAALTTIRNIQRSTQRPMGSENNILNGVNVNYSCLKLIMIMIFLYYSINYNG